MKSKTNPLFMLMFSYAVFSFAVYIPENKMGLYSWLMIISLNTVINILLILLVDTNKNLAVWIQNIMPVYLTFLFSKQLYKMWIYLKLYHGKQNGDSILYVTVFLILIFVVYSDIDISRFSLPLFLFTLGIFIIVLLVLADKVSRYNLYMHSKPDTTEDVYCVTMFDYMISILLINKSIFKCTRKIMIKYTLIVNTMLFFIIIYIFSCFKGEYMYSISPLQIGFQIFSSEYIRNLDGVFTFLIIFAYFAALVVISGALKAINHNYKYAFLLLSVLVFTMMKYMSGVWLLIVDLVAILILMVGRSKNEIQ